MYKSQEGPLKVNANNFNLTFSPTLTLIMAQRYKQRFTKVKNTYWSKVITSFFLVWMRASLRARSFASEPELTKKHTERGSGKVLTSLSARITSSSWRYRLFVDINDIWFRPASTTWGWQWPTEKRLIFSVGSLYTEQIFNIDLSSVKTVIPCWLLY